MQPDLLTAYKVRKLKVRVDYFHREVEEINEKFLCHHYSTRKSLESLINEEHKAFYAAFQKILAKTHQLKCCFDLVLSLVGCRNRVNILRGLRHTVHHAVRLDRLLEDWQNATHFLDSQLEYKVTLKIGRNCMPRNEE